MMMTTTDGRFAIDYSLNASFSIINNSESIGIITNSDALFHARNLFVDNSKLSHK